MKLTITSDLMVRLGGAEIVLSPRQGLRIAEDLARKSFRRALAEEADCRRPAAKPRSPALRPAARGRAS